MAAFPIHFRYSPESELLNKALGADKLAIESTIEQLSSAYPGIRQRMLDAVHQSAESQLWTHLFNCFAVGQWSEEHPLVIMDATGAAQRLHVAIVDAYLEDRSSNETEIKNTLLRQFSAAEEPIQRYAAAYLAGLRGDASALPVLKEALESEKHLWQLRSIQALSAIHDRRSADLLVGVMIREHEKFHQEARHSLAELGELAEIAWLEALEHTDPHIRWHAARGLAEVGNTSALPVLADGLCDENKTVRWVSSELLGRVGSRAIPDILKVIRNIPFSDECRQSAFHALRSIKNYRASECIKPLVSALSSPATKQIAQIIASRLLDDWPRLDGYISGRVQSIDQVN